MSHLLAEIGLRLAKALAALVLGIVIYAVATTILAAAPTVELALLSWLAAAAFILLVESSPI
jgi:hypothetical protein